jgi:alkanesulfonate monooxygenase SsuD/methylene tetrahydromethanopterin reductase-like flavin-dependent oxidoreductase (luciferase family)
LATIAAHRIGILVPEAWPLDRALDLARRAEDRGYWGVFPFEERGHDVVATMAAIASVTTRITVGSCIGSVFTRSAPIYAMAATTLSELSGGRFILGLGTSPPFFVKSWHDREWSKPVGHLKDTIRIVRAILTSGAPVDYEGASVSCHGFQLSVDRRARRLMCAVPAAPAGLRRAGLGGLTAWNGRPGKGRRGGC